LEADVVYVRDLARFDELSDEQVAYMALLAHHVYASVDLVHRCIADLVRRGVSDPGSPGEYLARV
jgi:hypothetical protein